MKKAKKMAEKFTTIGVRFDQDPARVWTYKIKARYKVRRGDALVVTNDRGTSVCFVVRVDPKPVMNPSIEYKWIKHRVAEIEHDADTHNGLG